MPFVIIPASQVAQKTSKVSKAKGSSPKQKVTQQRNTASGASRTTVTVAAYGAKLFEPIMTREKPIYVHFKEFIVRDDESITRFSEDGWFAIKFFLEKNEEGKSRCYLVYFLNPIDATENHSLMQACHEAIEYKIYEFLDKDEYVEVVKVKNITGRLSDVPDYNINKLRTASALGQAEQKIVEVLRTRITAEKFLKRQREYERQNLVWKQEFEKHLQEEELENEDVNDLEEGNTEGSTELDESEDVALQEEGTQEQEVHAEERQEVLKDELPKQEVSKRVESKEVASAKSTVPFVWGGKK